MNIEKKRSDVPGLPPGWKREEVSRKSGLSAGRTDVYYFSPSGKKIRSKPELARELGNGFDLSCFDFRSGKILQSAIRKSKKLKDIRHDSAVSLPIRQTASIFKQPVTRVRNRDDSNCRTDLKHGHGDPPKQLFWEKRIGNLRTCSPEAEPFCQLDLPSVIQAVGPTITNEDALHSIAACLHSNQQPITGQAASKMTLAKSPGVAVNPAQPLIQQVAITDTDIKRQELRVQEARKRLQTAMLAIHNSNTVRIL